MKKNLPPVVGYCDRHNKLLYSTRRAARAIARRYQGHKSVYHCDKIEGMFHIGGLPHEIIAGDVTRGEFFQERLQGGRDPAA